MRAAARLVAELILLGLLSGVLLVAVVVACQQIVDDEKVQFFLIGYYVAGHHELTRRIWKRLRIEKEIDKEIEKEPPT